MCSLRCSPAVFAWQIYGRGGLVSNCHCEIHFLNETMGMIMLFQSFSCSEWMSLGVCQGLTFSIFACVWSNLFHLCLTLLHALVQVVCFSNKDKLYKQYYFLCSLREFFISLQRGSRFTKGSLIFNAFLNERCVMLNIVIEGAFLNPSNDMRNKSEVLHTQKAEHC